MTIYSLLHAFSSIPVQEFVAFTTSDFQSPSIYLKMSQFFSCYRILTKFLGDKWLCWGAIVEMILVTIQDCCDKHIPIWVHCIASLMCKANHTVGRTQLGPIIQKLFQEPKFCFVYYWIQSEKTINWFTMCQQEDNRTRIIHDHGNWNPNKFPWLRTHPNRHQKIMSSAQLKPVSGTASLVFIVPPRTHRLKRQYTITKLNPS